MIGAILIAGGCSFSVTVPPGRLRRVARATLAVAHPTASFDSARVTDVAPGGWLGLGKRHLDIAIDYRGVVSRRVRTLEIRYLVDDLHPCRVRADVISDTGPIPPVLLDNALGEAEVGREVCRILSGRG